MVGFSSETPVLNPDEVESVKWITWQEWLDEVTNHPEMYSPWAIEETQLLSENREFNQLLTTSCNIGN
jgi:isopentenyldiphosphate isomerase